MSWQDYRHGQWGGSTINTLTRSLVLPTLLFSSVLEGSVSGNSKAVPCAAAATSDR